MKSFAVVVDKPAGMTSHDVVGRVRRACGTRQVGHAGTLDPMATGVLVALVGEATKLSSYVTLDDKVYETVVALGRDTTSHDREGQTTRERGVPSEIVAALAAAQGGEAVGPIADALAAERARVEQIPPIVSAIHVDGRRSHDLARAGEAPELRARPIRVLDLELLGADPDGRTLRLRVAVSKGYYVRSLARDLGDALGTGAHLVELRRIASGRFTLDDAVPLDDVAARTDARLGLEAIAARSFGVVRLTADGEERARVGKALGVANFAGELASPPARAPRLWISTTGAAIAIGHGAEDEVWRVLRGISPEPV